jgi:RNA polymerase sigma factor (sigma-70 family)
MNGEVRKAENLDDNEQLVRAIAEGDRGAEREFAVRYMPPVRAMLLARSRNPDLASDLRQDVMIEAICALRRGQLREPSKLTPFVLAIARNVLNNHYRASVRQPESLELPDDLPDLSSASETAEAEERESLAMEAISNLEPTDRSILQMILIDGLKPGAIAHRLNLSPDVVRQRKLRAIRRVTGLLLRSSQTEASGDTTLGRIG